MMSIYPSEKIISRVPVVRVVNRRRTGLGNRVLSEVGYREIFFLTWAFG